MKSNYEKILEFHDKFNVPIGRLGHIISDKQALLRARLMTEELAELIEAMQLKNYPEIARELGDVLYVVYGTATAYGIPMDAVFEELHKANMTKTGSRDKGGKIKKGPDYVPPDIEGVLK